MKKNYIIGSISVGVGLALIATAFALGFADHWFINLIASSVASGSDPLYFQHYANGLMAGGTIKVIPYYIILMPALLGWFFSYYGTYVLVNAKRATASTDMFKKEYWTEYQAKLAYKDRVLKRNNLIKKKVSKKQIKGPIQKKANS